MSGVAAEQLIYMRVEPAFSPQGRGGFQTVWRSAGIRAEDVTAIEERVQCFQPDHRERRRVQFFVVPSGMVVVARAVTIEPDQDIVDRNRRPGAFGVHCLALRQAQFAKFDDNPFVVLDAARWLNDPRQMVEAFGQATGEAPCQDLGQASSPPLPAQWRGQDARRLVVLGWLAAALRRDRQAVLMTGTSDEIEGALRVAFALLPRARRLACSFNTFGERCPYKPGDYWAVGAALTSRMNEAIAAAGGGRTIDVDAQSCSVAGATAVGRAGESLYLSWLERCLSEREPTAILEHSPTVEAMSAALAGEAPAVPGHWEPLAVSELFSAQSEAILEQLTSTARPLVGPGLASYLAGYLLRHGAALDGSLVLQALSPVRETVAVALARLAVEYLEDMRGGAVADADLRQLRKLAGEARNRVLLHWSSTLGSSRDEGARDQALNGMSSREFTVALALLRQPIPPADFVDARHLPALLRHERIAAIGDSELVSLVEAVLRIGKGDELGPLAALLPRLGAADVARLERAARGRKNVNMAPEFRQALESCLAARPHKTGWLGRRQ